MSGVVYSHAGVTLEVSTTVENSNLSPAEFAALTYVPVTNLGSLGEYGISTNMLSYETLSTAVTRKAKGITNAGDPQIEVARKDDDAGQIILAVAGAPQYFNSRAYRITKQDGAIDYLRGLLAGPNSPSGRNEDFDLHIYNLSLNQVVAHLAANAGPLWLFASGVLASDGIITTSGVVPA